MRAILGAAIALVAMMTVSVAPATAAPKTAGWTHTEGAAGGGRYSPLDDIHRGNVASLEVAWTYRHGDFHEGRFPLRVNTGTAMETTPLVVDGRLIFTTPYNRVIALDPETGGELWTFDPEIDLDRTFANMIINRGVAYWRSSDSGPPVSCRPRVFLATLDARLIALDAATGQYCPGFGHDGSVDLFDGLTGIVDRWEYNVTSPVTVVGDVVVVGSSIADTIRRAAPPGDVRAYDARSGALRWTFHTIPHEGETGYETWEDGSAVHSGGANVWSTITADPDRGLVFLPVSTATPDFYGGDRPGNNWFSDSVVALDVQTGRRKWHFQTVHHDLWDYDLAAPPVLVTVERDGKSIDAVTQATKSGFLFVLDRDTGAPLFPVEERPVPQAGVPGERTSLTQPMPTRPPPFVPQRLTEDDVAMFSHAHHKACIKKLKNLRNDGLFTPPNEKGSILYPFTAGGANWSGSAYDPRSGRLFIPAANLAHVIRLKKLPDSNFDVNHVRPLRIGLRAAWYVLRGRGTGLRYFLSPLNGRTTFAEDGVPCNKPPWGSLVAIDVSAGEIAWSVPTGESDDGMVEGLMSFGSPLVTAGGLVFHAGNEDLRMRAHDVDTGRVISHFALPAGLHAGPVTYKLRSDGKQYLVIAPGGHVGIGSKLGDYVIAYTLPTSDHED